MGSTHHVFHQAWDPENDILFSNNKHDRGFTAIFFSSIQNPLIKVATRKMSYETDISRPFDRLLTILAREENNISICKSLRKWTNQLSPRVGCYWGYHRPKPWGASRQNFAYSENCFYPFMSTNRHRLCNKKIFWGVLCNSNMGQIAYEEAKNFEFK